MSFRPLTLCLSALTTWGRIWESLGWWKSIGAAPHQAVIQFIISYTGLGNLTQAERPFQKWWGKIDWDLYDIVPKVGPIPDDVPKRPHSLQKNNGDLLKIDLKNHWSATCSHTFWWGELRSSRKRGTAPAATTAWRKKHQVRKFPWQCQLTWVCWLVPLAILVRAQAASNCRLLTYRH